MTYVCYDIKGIQRFIFSVPKLKCIVGGSSLIDKFDSDSSREPHGELIFSGGGRGAFFCTDESMADELKGSLVRRAHEVGLDVQFGTDSSLLEASRNAEEFYPYCPDDLSGYPCVISGLLPAHKGKANDKISLRMNEGRKDEFGKRILDGLRDHLPTQLRERNVEFVRNASPTDDLHDEENSQFRQQEQRHARAAQAALGSRNRWAVIAMDGNDIGSQFSAYRAKATKADGAVDEQQLKDWLTTMSREMKQCTLRAVLHGLESVLVAWGNDFNPDNCTYRDSIDEEVTVLPLRPLILGGDDVVLLCHSAYAFDFVRAVAEKFATESRVAAESHTTGQLWPGSGNELSISAGVLFANLHMPLHAAIPYAEDLLKNAKRVYRQPLNQEDSEQRRPTAAAIDFEVVTDSLLDTPTERRRRELEFTDSELGVEVRLSRRPYRLFAQSVDANPSRKDDTWEKLDALADDLYAIPPSVRAEFLPRMRGPWSQRVEFIASLQKRFASIAELYAEGITSDSQIGEGWYASEDNSRECGLADALVLLEEEKRSRQATT